MAETTPLAVVNACQHTEHTQKGASGGAIWMVEMSECPHCGRKAAVRLYCHDCVTRCMDTGRAVRLVCNVVRGGCGVDLDRRTVFSMLTLIPGAAA